MKNERLFEALEKIDEELIDEAAPGKKPPKKKAKTAAWVKWGAIVACALVIVGIGVPHIPNHNDGATSGQLESDGKVTSNEGMQNIAGEGENNLVTMTHMAEIKVKIDEMFPDGFRGTIEIGTDVFKAGEQITIVAQDNVTVVQEDGSIFAYDELEPNIPDSDLAIGSSVWVGFQKYDYVEGNGKYNQIFAYHVDGKERGTQAEMPAGQGYFNAVVIEVSTDSILVECTDSFLGEIAVGSKVEVSTDNISSEEVPELKAGDNIRILYIGEITGTDTLVLEKTVSIFLLDENNEVIVE